MPAVRTQLTDGVLIVTFVDSKLHDSELIQEIGGELIAAADRASGKCLVDFEGVAFMSSAMISQLIQLNKHCKASKIQLKLCGLCDNVLEVLKIMSLDRALSIYSDKAKALAAFQRGGWFS